MSLHLLLITCIISFTYALSANEFDMDMPEYDDVPIAESYESIYEQIEKDMDFACKGNLCTVASKTSHNRGWTFTVDFGEGAGNYGTNQGDTIIIGDNNAGQQEYWGVSVTYENMKCTATMEIDSSIYKLIKLYAETARNEDGTPLRDFVESQQVIMLMYVTIMNNVNDCAARSTAGGFSRSR